MSPQESATVSEKSCSRVARKGDTLHMDFEKRSLLVKRRLCFQPLTERAVTPSLACQVHQELDQHPMGVQT